MPFIIIDEPVVVVVVTQSELNKYREEYERDYMSYSGTPPSFIEYVWRKQEAQDKKEGE